MKNIKIITVLSVFFIAGVSLSAQCHSGKSTMQSSNAEVSSGALVSLSTYTLKVKGNCALCKARIEKNALANGAKKADWDKSSQTLVVGFYDKETSLVKIAKAIASVGHDNECYTASDESYHALPGCCKYQRN